MSRPTMDTIDTGLHLEAIYGNLLALSISATAWLEQHRPDVYTAAVEAVGTGAGHLEGRIVAEPIPMVMLYIAMEDGTALELAKLAVPNLAATH